jgi:DNA-binding transcriptional LysR family regulator
MIKPPFALPPELVWQPLLNEPFVLALPPASTYSDWREALRHEPFVRYDRASFGGRLVEQFLRRKRIAINESLELDELDAIAGAVEAGIGVALVPLTHTQRGGRFNIRILPLQESRFVREVGLIRLKQREGDASVLALAEALEAVALELD